VRAALVALCYACVLFACAWHDAAHRADTPPSHCTVCACVSVISLPPDAAVPTSPLSEAGDVVLDATPVAGDVTDTSRTSRAPPAIPAIDVHH
jgi:hypothetical protein